MTGADAGTLAMATTNESASAFAALVRWRLFDPDVSNDVMSKDLTSQSPSVTPGGVESPWKMGPAPATVEPLTTRAPSANDCPSETTRSRLAAPEPGYETPEIVSSQSAGSAPNAMFESLPFHATTLRSFDELPSL